MATELADAVARHAVVLLLALSALALVTARLAWHFIERQAPVLRRVAAPWMRRLDRRGVVARLLGLEGAISFVIAVAGAFAFIELTDALDTDDFVARFDVALAAALRRHLSPDTLALFARVTHLGDMPVLALLVAIGAIGLWLQRARLQAVALILVSGGAGAINDLLKLVFARERPEFVHELVRVAGYSFPSGHSAGSLATYGFAAYLLVRMLPRRWHLATSALAILLIVFVGASRVLLQVHYLSDVVAGWLGATVWTALCIATMESVRLTRLRRAAR